MFNYLLVVLFSILGLPSITSADTAYVIDKIEIGIHSDRSLSSPILKIIPSRTPLEIIERGGDMTKVEILDGTVGWVNSAYVVAEKSNQPNTDLKKIEQLELALKNSKLTIKQLQTDLDRVKHDRNNQDVESLKLQIARLKDQLQHQDQTNKPNTEKTTVQELQVLKQKNSELEQTILHLNSSLQANTTIKNSISKENSNLLMIIGVSIIIGILLGIVLFDLYKRHQYGGFRI